MSVQPVTEPPVERDMRLLYAGVIVIEALVLIGIWLVQRYFGA
jgi:hypothetical protein